MKSLVLRQCAGAVACATSLVANAQSDATPVPTPTFQLDTIVVTASRSPQDARDVLGDVTVIDHQTLRQAGQSSLVETLSHASGIEYTQSGGVQSNSSLFIRGANSQHTLVLVDGIRINSSITGLANLNAFSPDMLERVEVLRGSASSLYGADAIGGVVNIITRHGDEDRPLAASASAGYGSEGTLRTRLGIAGAQNGWDYSLATSYGQSRGFNATKPSSLSYNPDRDGYYENSVVGSLGYRWAPGHRVGLTVLNAKINGQFDAGPDFMTGEYFNDRATTRQQVYALSSTDDINAHWQSVLRAGYSKDNYREQAVYGDSHFGSEQKTYTWQNNFTLTEEQQLSLVLERLEERVLASNTYSNTERDTNSVGLIYRGDFGPHHLQLNARDDDNSQYGNETTAGASYGYDLTSAWRVSVAGNTGFKAPDFQSLYYPYFANPNLDPERSRNVEAGLRYTTDVTRLALVAYHNKVRDLIVSSVATGFVPYNVNSATLRGVTLSGEQILGDTTLRASADFQDPHDDETGNQLARRAKQIYRFGADQRIGALTLGTEVLVSGKRYDDAANATRLGGYTVVNLLAGYEINRNLQAQLRWNNVLDRDYTLVNGYETPGSNVFVNLAWRM